MNRFFDKNGFTLMEVMITAAIGGFIIMTLGKYMSNVEKQQKRIERRDEYRNINFKIKELLGDAVAWQMNPEVDVPKQDNSNNFYYFPGDDREDIKQLTIYSSQPNDEKYSCELQSTPTCRLMYFDKTGQLIDIKKIGAHTASYYKVIIFIDDYDEDVERAYPPNVTYYIYDKHPSKGIRNNPRKYYFDSPRTHPKYNSIAAAMCFREAKINGLGDSNLAAILCRNAESSAPASCYSKMKRHKLDDDINLIVCHKAKSDAPARCYSDARDKFSSYKNLLPTLCNQATNNSPLECFDRMVEHSSNRAKLAANLCSRARNLDPYYCFERLQEVETIEDGIVLQLCPNWREG